MAYGHYWRRAPELNVEGFNKAVEDIRRLIEKVKEKDVKLSGPAGFGDPELSDFSIAFNGSEQCGHIYMDLGKPWPSKIAEGVMATSKPIAGPWFQGALLDTRVCGGCCCYEPFVVDRKFMVRPWDQLEDGRYYCFVETLYKPYDLMVTAALIRLKEHLGNQILISSDGLERGFEDAKRLCRELFGFTKHFKLEVYEALEEPEVV